MRIDLRITAGLLAPLAAIGFAVSCAKKDSLMSLNVITNTSPVLPGDDTDCAGNDATGPRLIFQSSEIKWKSSEKLYLAAIQIRIKAANKLKSDFSCDIGGDQLKGTFGLADDGQLPVNASSPENTFSTACPIKCFGIGVSDEKTPFKISGEAKAIAYSVNRTTGEQTPLTARATVFVQYTP